MELAGCLAPGGIVLHLRGLSHDEVIHELVDVACGGSDGQRRDILNSVYNVEDIRNTAVGRGVAIPHGRTNAVPRLIIVFGRSVRGIAWGAPDGKPVKLVWLIINPLDEIESYLDVLAQITKLCVRKRARDAILRAKEPDEVFRVIRDAGRTAGQK